MSVHTPVSQQELLAFISDYSIGELVNYSGIKAGVTNTIYHLKTTTGEYVLTLFEELSAQQLPFYINFMRFLHQHNIPCQQVYAAKTGEDISILKNKATIIVNYLPGVPLDKIDSDHCAAVGATLGKIHCLSQNFPQDQKNLRDHDWREKIFAQLTNVVGDDIRKLLEEEIHFHQKHPLTQLPQGIIHADLFRDNVLFNKNTLTGIIDFYYACNGAFLYDLAVTINDWCLDTNDQVDETKKQALLQAYQQHRSLTDEEQQHWSIALRLAALRFCLSRYYDYYFVERDADIQVKDPEHFKKLLCHYRELHRSDPLSP